MRERWKCFSCDFKTNDIHKRDEHNKLQGHIVVNTGFIGDR
jgi:hypothetical protein